MARIRKIRGTLRNGFTLVELTAIVLIVAILAFTVVPRFLSKSTVDVSIMAQQLANDIRFTQALAMTSGQRNRINLTAATYQITTSSGGPVVHPVTRTSAPITLNNVSLSGFNPPLVNNYVAFDSKGVPYVDVAGTQLTANATITLAAGGVTRTIVVAPQTGNVTVP